MGGRETIEKRREKLSAGTEKSDRQWEHVKGAVPKQWATKRISKIKKKESWAYLYQGCWRRQVSGICSINWDNCVQKVADRQGKKGGATTCAIKFDDRCGVFKKKSVVDRVPRNFDCHILE